MKCIKCGNENAENAKFCRKCGAKLEEIKEESNLKAPSTSNKEEDASVQNTKNQENAKAPSKTPNKETSNKEKPNKENKEKKKGGAKKVVIIIIVLLVIAAIGFGAYFIYDNFFYQYDQKVEENLDQYFETNDAKYIEKIEEIISKYSDDQEALTKIKDVSNKKITKWIEDANAAEYQTAEEVEEAFSGIESKIKKLEKANAIESEEKDTYLETIESLVDSKTNYIDGLSKYEDEKYDKAYSSFGKVIEEDKLYESAQSYIEKCIGDTISSIESKYNELITIADGTSNTEIKSKYVEAYKYLIEQNTSSSIDLNDSESYQKLVTESMSKIIEQSVNIITENINNKDYTTAKTDITELVGYIEDINDNKEYKDVITSALTKVTELTGTAADSLIANYNYSDAKQLVSDVKTELAKLDSTSTYTTTLDDKITEIEDKMPVSLLSLSTRSKDSSISLKTTSLKDADGNLYEGGITKYCSSEGSANCTYNLNGAYKKLKATYGVCAANSSNDTSAYIKIYGDDKLLYTSEAIRWDSLPKELDVNISGVQMLKIEFVSEDLDRDVFIGNPELYK